MAKVWRFELTSESGLTGQLGLSHVHFQSDVATLGDEDPIGDVLDRILAHFSSSGHNMVSWTNVMDSNSTLVGARLREEVKTWEGEIGEVAEESLNLSGTGGSPSGDNLPTAVCAWLKFGTGVSSKSARGGTHTPFMELAPRLGPNGTWDMTTGFWDALVALGNDIVDSFSIGTITPVTYNSVIYSRTRRRRGFEPWTFNLTQATPSDHVRWLRRRES